jgi:protein-S-isoprenylcysteine O-methyltransferase Ste14
MIQAIVVLAYISLGVELAVFPVPSVASAVSMMKRSARPLITRALVFALPTLLCIGVFLLPLGMAFAPALRSSLGPIQMLESNATQALGVLLVVLGRLLTFNSVLTMRGGDASAFAPARPSELRGQRLFSHSRNPGLVGMFSFYLGLVMIYPCWVLLLGIPLYFGNMHLRVLLEESDLSAKFGTSYQAYCERTRRYL